MQHGNTATGRIREQTMNTIAAQIDYATDVFKATNDLLEASAEYRKAQEFGNVIKVIDAQVKVLKAELALDELTRPVSEPPLPDADPLPDCGERFPPRQREARMHPDDPRKGQSAGLNALIRKP